MLEETENSLESTVLETLTAAETLMPKLITERVLLASFEKNSFLKTDHQKFFTKKRLLKEKTKILKMYLQIYKKLECVSDSEKGRKVSLANRELVRGIERILENLEGIRRKSCENGYFPLFKSVHDAWRIRSAKGKEKSVSNMGKTVAKYFIIFHKIKHLYRISCFITKLRIVDNLRNAKEDFFKKLISDTTEMSIINKNLEKLNHRIQTFKIDQKFINNSLVSM